MYIKDEWQKQRAKLGLIVTINSDYPNMKDKCVFNKFKFSKVYWKLTLNSMFLSAIVFLIVLATSTSYDLLTEFNLVKTTIQIFMIYAVFLNLGTDEYMSNTNNDDNRINWIKLMLQPFNTMKNKLIQNVVNYEYANLKKNIHSTLREWFDKRDCKNDKIGVFIIRLDRLVKKNKNEDVEDGLISLYEDRLYNLYINYKEDKDIYLMDDLNNIIPEFLIEQLGISIYELSKYISDQLDTNMSRSKIKKEIDKYIKYEKKDARDVTEEEIIEDLLG